MGMHSYVIGIKPPDEDFEQMLAAYQACNRAGVAPPEEVMRFFQYEAPEPKGVVVDNLPGVVKYSDAMKEGFEVDISQLPPDVKIVRFVNSY